MEETGRQRFLQTYGHRRSVLRQRFSYRNLKKRPPGQTFSRTSITSFLVPTKNEYDAFPTGVGASSDETKDRERQPAKSGTAIPDNRHIEAHLPTDKNLSPRTKPPVNDRPPYRYRRANRTKRIPQRRNIRSGSYPAQSRTKNPKRTGRPFGRAVLFGFFFPDRNYCARNHMDFTVERKYGDRPFRTRRKSRHSGDRNGPDRTHGHGPQTAASSRPSPPPAPTLRIRKNQMERIFSVLSSSRLTGFWFLIALLNGI